MEVLREGEDTDGIATLRHDISIFGRAGVTGGRARYPQHHSAEHCLQDRSILASVASDRSHREKESTKEALWTKA